MPSSPQGNHIVTRRLLRYLLWGPPTSGPNLVKVLNWLIQDGLRKQGAGHRSCEFTVCHIITPVQLLCAREFQPRFENKTLEMRQIYYLFKISVRASLT